MLSGARLPHPREAAKVKAKATPAALSTQNAFHALEESEQDRTPRETVSANEGEIEQSGKRK